MISRVSVLVLSLLLVFTTQAACAVDIPSTPRNYVVDLAQIVNDSTEARLNGYLQELERKTTAQVVVLTIPSLEGNDLNEFSLEVANDMWKLGQKGKDNGLLLLVALQERKYRFEVGYGLEGILPDSLVGSIGRQQLVPKFKQGDYSSGIASAVLTIANIIAKDSGVEIAGMPVVTYQSYPVGGQERQRSTFASVMGIIIFFVIVGIVLLSFKHPATFTSGSGGSRYWRGGGGYGGGFGGGGSFGGGGGGSFGGGGASGGW